MTTSESIKSVMTAIGNVQQNVGTVAKGSTGQVGQRNYKYAGLNEVWQAVSPLLKDNKLVVTQSPALGERGYVFITTIYHTGSEEWISEQMPLILQRDDPQGMGSAITYYRRYMLLSMLGLIPDDDNDAKDHRFATAQQKLRIVGAVKQLNPDITQPDHIIKTVMDIVGKHPSNIREDEADRCVDLIKAFGSKS